MGEVKNGPQIGQAVFYGCSSQGDARVGLEFLDLARLFGARVFDGLRFVDHGQTPLNTFQLRQAQ